MVVGAGPGVSGSVARRFAREGYDVALVGIDEEVLTALSDELRSLGAAAEWTVVDITDVDAAAAEVAKLGERFGRVDVLHFNPSAFREKDPLSLTVPELLEDVALGVGALLTSVQAARPFMSAGGRVTVTGSMAADKPWNQAASLGVQKAGVRNLVHSLDTTLEPEGIRAVSVTVRGTLSKEGPFTPDRVAEAVWSAAHQDEVGLADRGAVRRLSSSGACALEAQQAVLEDSQPAGGARMLLVPRQLRRTGMTGDVPYYGGRFTPAQAYAASHPAPTPAPPPRAPTSTPDPMAALDHLLDAGLITPEEYDDLRARVAK